MIRTNLDINALNDNEPFFCELNNKFFIIIKNNKNQKNIKIFENICPHQGNKFSYNSFDKTNNILECSWHGCKFNLEDGYSLNKKLQLLEYSYLLENGKLIINEEI